MRGPNRLILTAEHLGCVARPLLGASQSAGETAPRLNFCRSLESGLCSSSFPKQRLLIKPRETASATSSPVKASIPATISPAIAANSALLIILSAATELAALFSYWLPVTGNFQRRSKRGRGRAKSSSVGAP